MVLEYVRRLVGAREKPDPRELLGLVEAVDAGQQQGGAPPFDLYTLLEDEKVGRELWPYILGFVARDTKLTYFTERDEEYLFWKIEAIATKIEMALNSQTPPPDRFPRVEDYVKVVEAQRLLADNLRVLMLAAVRRSTLGFERRLQAMRHFVFSYSDRRF
ncbi:hypothetical protein ASQ66_gp09 [Aeropyrum pernix spindle-shaped virus 1]|uniref:Uncharacterized protein n=1 Tax=Aeropyrum pernix (strain ATCC 700893 / DSM 11879 / JCM 9820 / NBRC 100138 / K1) TaxID=272557 RepID=Q9YDU0_AERPE|nr:hypothetical protein [Aeropyrum pernix]YP_009177739.1 hypothetical protein ASQ66_gp09 [Aeropyrum pernix spindle-shaped virus 1]BAA79807.2 hypothetical protein APE_0827.1 [Aeropyrum pernix spindle-shaped virus 1] [Aeropyrum pernix K1]CCD22097.1 TPA: hypothetical protein [Aeropyrum pernix spindle-shaped virus 1]